VDESHLAEGRRADESWREMIERLRKERDGSDNSWRERLRSLPQEEKDKGRSDDLCNIRPEQLVEGGEDHIHRRPDEKPLGTVRSAAG
jgi:hypothetical protein